MSGDPASPGLCYACRADVAIEDFGERSLILLSDSLQLREINGASRRILALLDGRRTVADVAAEIAAQTALSIGAVQGPVEEALRKMEQQAIVRREAAWARKGRNSMNESRYLANPDVSFRREGEDGGILFNPDTDSLEVLNPTATVLWAFLAAPHTSGELVDHLCDVCADASRGQVVKDVGEFLDSMVQKGFIGLLAEDA